MSIPFAKRSLASHAAKLGTSMALAIGGMITTLEAAPPAIPVQEIERFAQVSYVNAQQKSNAERCIAAANEYISCLDRMLTTLRKFENAPESISIEKWLDRLDSTSQLEERLDAELVKARVLGSVLAETRQARKLLGMVRIRLTKIVSEINRLSGNTEQFDSNIDVQGFYALSDARNDQVGRRYH